MINMKTVQHSLYIKYGKDINNKINIYIINNVINNKKNKFGFKINENRYNDNFLKDYISNYYKISDCIKVLKNFYVLHQEYFTYYLNPTFADFYCNKLIWKLAELKAEIFYDKKYKAKFTNKKDSNINYSLKNFFSNSVQNFLNKSNKNNNNINSLENISKIDKKVNEKVESFISFENSNNNSFLKILNSNESHKIEKVSTRDKTYIMKLVNTKKTISSSNSKNKLIFKNIKTLYNKIKNKSKPKRVINIANLDLKKQKNNILLRDIKNNNIFHSEKRAKSIETKIFSKSNNKNDRIKSFMRNYKPKNKFNNFTVSLSEQKRRVIKIKQKDFGLRISKNSNTKFPKIQEKLFNSEKASTKFIRIKKKNIDFKIDIKKKLNYKYGNSWKFAYKKTTFGNI